MAEESGAAPTAPLERKLATILSADVAGYSRLMAEDEEDTLRTFRSHREVFEQLVALHRGRVFNTAGDAILAEFASAVEAVRCATEVQAALATRNEALPASRQVRFRIGVNLGDVMVQGSDLLGDGVNVAARLQAAAEPGGVCISGSIYDQIRNKLSLTFRSLGEQSFKNIPQPVRTFSISGSETHGAFPAPRGKRRGALAVIAAAVLLVLAGGGYWAFAEWQRSRAEQTRLLAEAESGRKVAERREAQLRAEKQAAEEAQRRADVDRQAAETARRETQLAAERARSEQAVRLAEADKKRAEDDARRATEELRRAEDLRKKEEAPRQAVAAAPSAPPGAIVAAPGNLTALDGLYAGPICYGPGAKEKPRCFRAQGTVASGKITGRWANRDSGVTMVLSGLVSAAGDVQLELHGERADHPRILTILLNGSLRDGKLEASGQFTSGRPATLSWQRQ